ncbi:unnamed protein product [Choristocarpus tenellus]
MCEGTGWHGQHFCLSHFPDGALAIILSYGDVASIVEVLSVSRSWDINGNRTQVWQALAKHFEVDMPASLTPGKGRVTRSSTNAKRTFLRAYALATKAYRIRHDATVSEVYHLFRRQDSVLRLRKILRSRWGPSSAPPMQMPSSPPIPTSPSPNIATPQKRSHWCFNVDHRHGIWEGNTILNFAARCGCRKVATYLIWVLGAGVDVPDDGGFTPLLNAAWRGDVALMKQLLAAGGDPWVLGYSQRAGPLTPLQWAERQGRVEAADFLRKYIDTWQVKLSKATMGSNTLDRVCSGDGVPETKRHSKRPWVDGPQNSAWKRSKAVR